MLSPTIVSQALNIFLSSAVLFSLSLGIFVFLKNKKSPLNIMFLWSGVAISVWLFGTYMMLKNCFDEGWVVFWDRIVYLGVIWIPVFIYHFILEFTQKIKNKIYKNILFFGYFFGALLCFISQTDYFVKGVFHYKWGCHTIARAGHHVLLIHFSFYTFCLFYLLFDYFKKVRNPILKNQTKYLLVAFVLLLIGSVEFLPAYKISVFPIGYFFPLIWLGVIAYSFTQYRLLNLKLIGTDILVGTIIFSMSVFTILSENINQLIGRGVFLFLVFIASLLAVQGVHKEILEKERLERAVEERTKELQESKKELERAYYEMKKEKEKFERLYNLTVGREIKMVELKKKIQELEEKLRKETKKSES